MTPAEFKAEYPEFDSVDDSAIQRQIDAFGLLYQGDYGDLADYLSGLYVAHQVSVYTVNTSSGPAQVVKSRTVDGLSWSYADNSTSSSAGEFGTTKYGTEFYRLMQQLGMGPVMAGRSRV